MLLQRIKDYLGYAKLHSSLDIELKSLSGSFQSRALPDLPKLIKNDGSNAVWKISLSNEQNCYMSAKRNYANNDNSFIVNVDSERFYHAWLKSSVENNGHCVARQEMPLDYKYTDAEVGFSHGIENPVPLADAYVYPVNDDQDLVLSLSNGITRSFWLIANQADSFPIHVINKDIANQLHKLVGIGDIPLSFEEFFVNNNTPFDNIENAIW